MIYRNWERVADQQTFSSIGYYWRWDDGMLFALRCSNHAINSNLIQWLGIIRTTVKNRGIVGIDAATTLTRLNGFVSLDAGHAPPQSLLTHTKRMDIIRYADASNGFPTCTLNRWQRAKQPFADILGRLLPKLIKIGTVQTVRVEKA